jgi:hypothetical protein
MARYSAGETVVHAPDVDVSALVQQTQRALVRLQEVLSS